MAILIGIAYTVVILFIVIVLTFLEKKPREIREYKFSHVDSFETIMEFEKDNKKYYKGFRRSIEEDRYAPYKGFFEDLNLQYINDMKAQGYTLLDIKEYEVYSSGFKTLIFQRNAIEN